MMKRVITALLGISLLTTLLAGCGTEKQPSQTEVQTMRATAELTARRGRCCVISG